MIRGSWPWVMLAAVILTLQGCASTDMAGSTSETENMLGIRALRVDSLLGSWDYPTEAGTVATIRLDSSNFDFRRSTASGQDVSVERTDGVALPFEIVVWDSASARGRLHVRLGWDIAVWNDSIALRWGLPAMARTNPKAVWANIPDFQRLSINSVLVDDFERGSLRSQLPDSGSWYCRPGDSGAVVAPSLVNAGKGRSGTALHMAYTAKVFALIGLNLGGHRCFRSLDSLVFWARGAGKIYPAFDNLDPQASGKAWTHIQLDSSKWTRICIRPQDLDSANGIGGNVGWLAVRDRVTNLTFLVGGGHDLYLDDIRLYGMDPGDFK